MDAEDDMPLDLILKEENEQQAIDNAMQHKQPILLSTASAIEGGTIGLT